MQKAQPATGVCGSRRPDMNSKALRLAATGQCLARGTNINCTLCGSRGPISGRGTDMKALYVVAGGQYLAGGTDMKPLVKYESA